MLTFLIKICLIFTILGVSFSTVQIDQNSDNETEEMTESIQEDTTVPNLVKSEDKLETIDDLENSTMEEEAEVPIETQDEDKWHEPQSDQLHNGIVDQISSLSEQILDLVESYADQNNITSNSQNFSKKRQFFLTFMTEKSNGTRKMTVNNNFQATNLAPTQVFVEQGTDSKQLPSPNIQMTIPGMQQTKQNNVQNNIQNPMQNQQYYPNYSSRKFSRNLQNRNPYPYYQNPVQG